jgi:hypothetical protein
METLNIQNWIVRYDRRETLLAYSQIDMGGPEACGCEPCLNFAAAREKVYPKDIREVFDHIGIDYRKESEVFHCNKEDNGLHCYGGEFLFVGSVENTDEAYDPSEVKANVLNFEDNAQNFVWSFSARVAYRQSVFENKPTALFFFAARVPWVLQTKEPD